MGIKMATASIGLLGISTYGIHLIIIGWVMKGTKPTIFDIVALILAIAGTTLIIPEFSFTNDVTLGIVIAICPPTGSIPVAALTAGWPSR